jgi:hypothetical protein
MSSGESMSKGRPGGQARVKSARSLYKEQKGGQPESLSEIDSTKVLYGIRKALKMAM